MRLRSLLTPELRLELITGEDELDRVIRWVVTTDMRDPSRYLVGGELVLTGLVWRRDPSDTDFFVARLAKVGISALAAWDAAAGNIPEDLADACRRHHVPLFKVPADMAFATLTEHVVRRLSTERAADLSAVLERHRRLVAGTGLGPILELLGTPCWVMTPAGQVIAGSDAAPAPAADFGAAFLGASRLPCVWDGYSIFPVDGDARVADWFIVVEGEWEDWPAERRALPGELAAIVALERARRDDRRAASLVCELLALIVSDDAVATDIPPRLRVMGADADGGFVAVTAAPEGDLRPGELRVIFRELLADQEAMVGLSGNDVIAVVPVPKPVPRSARPPGEICAGAKLVARITAALDALTPGLRRDRSRIAVGVSCTVEAIGLRGAVEEARYARKMAASRPGAANVVGHDELGTHALFLATVPDDVRQMFRDQLLGPLLDYDRRHRADLIGTLEAFLRCSGSWTKCGEMLHLHVNSLRYRIHRIEEITGRDLSLLEDRVDFFLALRL